ncbi:hypothetical protein BD289DRAFT_469757, partial [Coniella lustricola]
MRTTLDQSDQLSTSFLAASSLISQRGEQTSKRTAQSEGEMSACTKRIQSASEEFLFNSSRRDEGARAMGDRCVTTGNL